MTGLVLCALLAAPGDGAEPGYEDRLVRWGLEQHGRAVEPAPEGRRVDEVLIAAEDVFAPSDPWPTLLNVFHTKTREAIIRREVLIRPGETWTAERIAETERILRRLYILAVVKLVPVKGQDGGVALLVVTKDRWSLRLNSEFTLIGPLLQYLRLRPTEMNFLGRNQQLAVDFIMKLDTIALGETFTERRLFGTSFSFREDAALVLNRRSGAPEGTFGAVTFGLPLITLDQEWGFSVNGSWNVGPRRVFRGADVWLLPYPTDGDAASVPYVYNARELAGEASVTRSFGRAFKIDATLAAGAWLRQYTPPAHTLTDEQAAWLTATHLPRSETATYVSAFTRMYSANFKVLHDLDTYQLSEDFQVGPLIQAGVRWAVPTPWSSSFVELGAALRYRLYQWEDLLTLSVAGQTRLRPGLPPANNRLAFEVINYSPPIYGGRFVTRVMFDVKADDLDNRVLLLGGSNGLRGAYPEQLSGRNVVLANFEYRARPFELLTNWVGLVFFYDVGSAFDSAPVLTHTLGAGLRILLPHFNVDPIRIDFGIVLNSSANPGIDRLNASYGQVTDFRPAVLDQPI